MKLFDSEEKCCGCTACYSICPRSAINMERDEKGFLYPIIDESKCVNCNLCKMTCDFQNENYIKNIDIEDNYVYAVKNKKLSERLTSRSGGVFMSFCDYVLAKEGSVYGAVFDDNLKVIHKRTDNKTGVDKFKGSKYVQSEIGNNFLSVKKDLDNGKNVLFSGTACQVAGLKSFLNRTKTNTEKLILCDLVCHGVPSPLFYEKYLGYIENKTKSKVTEFNFRDKYFGWAPHIESFKSDKKHFSNLYTDLFYKHIMFRPSCSNCKYTNFNRPSDLTIADFWGIDKAVKNFNDNKGVSLLIINTKKGNGIFENVKDSLEYVKSNKKDCLQPNLEHPTVFSKDTEQFWKDFREKGIEYVMKKYGNLNVKSQLKFKLKVFLYKHHLRGM